MTDFRLKHLLEKEMTRKQFLAFGGLAAASLFGASGLVRELASHAATPFVTTEPEKAAVTSPTTIVSDTTASGGQAIQFGPDKTFSNFIVGITEPNAGNTGVPDTKVFAAADIISSDIVITTPGTIIDGKEIRACVTVKAADVVIRNCRIIGPQAGPAGRPLVYHIDPAVKNFHLEQCTLRPTHSSDGTDTLMGHNIVRIRNNISRGVDGSGSFINTAYGTFCNYLVQGDYIHDLAYYCPSTTHSDNHSHNDANQHHNGTGVTFEGVSIHGYWDPAVGDGSVPGTFDSTGKCLAGNCNDIYGKTPVLGRRNINATFQMNQNSGGSTNDFHIINSWVYGGASSINVADTTLAMTLFELRGNRFEVPLYGRNAIIIAHSASSAQFQCTGNTYMDTGLPMLGTVGNGRTNQI